MKEYQKMIDNSWVFRSYFHKSWMNKIKEKCNAYHVCHIQGHVEEESGEKLNVVHIKSKDTELKFGGYKPFKEFTSQDYEAAIDAFNEQAYAS